MIITPILDPAKRMEFNRLLRDFSRDNYGMRPESAEKLCYNFHSPIMAGQRIYMNVRVVNEGDFDRIEKESVDPIKLERSLRDLSLWLLVTFKDICNKQGLRFDKDEIGISDISTGARAII